ncbi:hypothetical protein ABZ622_03125 [Streptomyces sp. NPDC007164]|uniref:hypothetical protein n=1 Tax=Streptomyces sp. NPDC007164 TaxID=3156918 RepID=UPI0033FF19A7
MGLDITVVIADWSWLGEVPEHERLLRLRNAWYADETGLWEYDTPTVEGDWVWPKGPNGGCFALYEFLQTLGSYKPHFWATHHWERVRDHTGPPLRAGLDAFLLGLIWDGMDGESGETDADFFSGEPEVAYGLLIARSPDNVRRLAALWEDVRPRLDGLRETFTVYSAVPDGRGGDFDSFALLLTEWGRILTEAAGRGWGVVGLSE